MENSDNQVVQHARGRPDHSAKDTDHEGDTLSRSNPLAEFLKNQKINMKDMKEEDFMAQYEAFMKANGYLEHGNGRSENKQGKNQSTTSDHTELRRKNDGDGQIKNIVLKFTTLSEGNVDAPSFTVDQNGAKIGRNTSNQICVPSDARLAPEAHSTIEFYRGGFYINDGGYTFSASIRIGLNNGHNKKWFMDKDARFSAGNSVIESRGVDERGDLELFVIEGPLKDKVLKINRKGATFGRSSDNHVCIPDRELSRKHSRVDFDERSGRYTVNDMGSTNGTYIQLVGPYSGRYKLSLNDHILVGRTGFSINRYDYGLSEEIGYRQTMEDACTIVQHLNIAPLCMPTLSPQSFFGVFDGHGGTHASQYLAQSLHVNVAHGLLDETDNIYKVIDECAPHSIFDSHFSSACAELDRVVLSSLRESFLKTDAEFIHSSPCPQHGSTATTALILGRRLYCANVGDSRTMICRNFTPILMSEDHKPYREDEAKRIKDAGGFVINNRVMGELAVSRAFGDADFKKSIQSIIEEEGGSIKQQQGPDDIPWDQPLIIAEPDTKILTLADEDQFLLLACDGLFDVFSPEEVVDFVRTHMIRHGDAQKCCQSLTFEAIRKRNSRDNVTVILIILNKWY